MAQQQNEKLKKAAEQFAPHILPNIGKLRWMARLEGVSLSEYSDQEILDIIRMSCVIALSGTTTFVFKPVYAA